MSKKKKKKKKFKKHFPRAISPQASVQQGTISPEPQVVKTNKLEEKKEVKGETITPEKKIPDYLKKDLLKIVFLVFLFIVILIVANYIFNLSSIKNFLNNLQI